MNIRKFCEKSIKDIGSKSLKYLYINTPNSSLYES